MNNAIIIRYCEIHLKGKNRGFFEKLLRENIKKSLKGINFNFVSMHSRYLVQDFADEDYNVITEKLAKIPGIHTYSKALVVDNDFEQIFEACKLLCADKTGTFKVETNRADKNFSPNSMQTSMLLGGRLLEIYGDKLKVDVKSPSFIVNVDIREDGKSFIYTDVIHCISGMPVGSA